jgi:hypothetical protein
VLYSVTVVLCLVTGLLCSVTGVRFTEKVHGQ